MGRGGCACVFDTLAIMLGVLAAACGAIVMSMRHGGNAGCLKRNLQSNALLKVGETDGDSADSTLLAMAIPSLFSGVVLVMWSFTNHMDGWRVTRHAERPKSPADAQLRTAVLPFAVAAVGIWLTTFAGVAADTLLEGVCEEYYCSAAEPVSAPKVIGVLACMEASEGTVVACSGADVCCGCRQAPGAPDGEFGAPAAICRADRDWACDLRSRRGTAGPAVAALACTLSALAVFSSCRLDERFCRARGGSAPDEPKAGQAIGAVDDRGSVPSSCEPSPTVHDDESSSASFPQVAGGGGSRKAPRQTGGAGFVGLGQSTLAEP